MKRTLAFGSLAAVIAATWLVVNAGAQSSSVAPIVRDVNSDGTYQLLNSMDTALSNLSQDASHGSAALATGPQIMLEASDNFSANTAVADGSAVRPVGDLAGRAIQLLGCDRGARLSGVTAITDGASTAATGFGATASTYNEVWDVIVANTSASAVTLDIRNGTAGAVLATFPVPANTSGFVHAFTVPLTGSVNTAIAIDPSAAVSTITTTLVGCKAK